MKNYLMFRFWVINSTMLLVSCFFLFFYMDTTFVENLYSKIFTALVMILLILPLQIIFKQSYEKVTIKEIFKILITWGIFYCCSILIVNESILDYMVKSNFFIIGALSNFLLISCSIVLINFIRKLSVECVLLISDGSSPKLDERKEKLKSFDIIKSEASDESKILEIISTHNISKIIFDQKSFNNSGLVNKVTNYSDTCSDIFRISDLSSNQLGMTDFLGVMIVPLNQNKMLVKPISNLIKRAFDFSLSSILIIMLMPLFLLIALSIKFESNGPIFFIQKRNGLNGKVFNILKFRSMYFFDDAKVIQAKKNDSRVTKIGKFLRKSSIDELPQIFNIFLGEMSFVGPRPHAIEHNHEYGIKIKNYMRRHLVKPGLTGYAQIKGHRGETRDVNAMKNRVKCDLAYIEEWSIWLDLVILLKTPVALLKDEAY